MSGVNLDVFCSPYLNCEKNATRKSMCLLYNIDDMYLVLIILKYLRKNNRKSECVKYIL